MHRHTKQVITAGQPLAKASQAIIMIHGRGGSPEGILEIADLLPVGDFAQLAPAATAHSWYPYSFMAPLADNQPGLSTALAVIDQLVQEVVEAGIGHKNLYFLGFSQGACLTSEYLARHGRRYGGAFILSGGVIGPQVDRSNYGGAFDGTPMLLGCSDVDPHIPLHRVQESSAIFRERGAQVNEQIYPNAPHSIFKGEIEAMRAILEE